ncbi:MAG: hypothetical protein ACXVPL_06895 [Actinomycetota bacterium]
MLEQEGLGVASLFGRKPNGKKKRRTGLRERWRSWRRRHFADVRIPGDEHHAPHETGVPDIPRPQGLPGFPIDRPGEEPPRET